MGVWERRCTLYWGVEWSPASLEIQPPRVEMKRKLEPGPLVPPAPPGLRCSELPPRLPVWRNETALGASIAARFLRRRPLHALTGQRRLTGQSASPPVHRPMAHPLVGLASSVQHQLLAQLPEGWQLQQLPASSSRARVMPRRPRLEPRSCAASLAPPAGLRLCRPPDAVPASCSLSCRTSNRLKQ